MNCNDRECYDALNAQIDELRGHCKAFQEEIGRLTSENAALRAAIQKNCEHCLGDCRGEFGDDCPLTDYHQGVK